MENSPINSSPINLELSMVPPKALNVKVGKTLMTSGLVKSILNDRVLEAGIAHLVM